MIKGALDKQTVKPKGIAEHKFVGSVGTPLQMKGQMDTFKSSQDSVTKTMSMKAKTLKGQC